MNLDPASLDLTELSDRAGVSARTVRYYIQQGLLPAPDSRGPSARYGPEHLDRLNLIRALQREHLPLAEIRRRLENLGPDDIRRLARESPAHQQSSARDYIRGVLSEGAASLTRLPVKPAALSASRSAAAQDWKSFTRAQWDRIVLAPDVELHVRRPLSREQNRQVERLMDAARNIFEENEP